MLSKAEKDYLIDLLEKGESIPDEFKYKFFLLLIKSMNLHMRGKCAGKICLLMKMALLRFPYR